MRKEDDKGTKPKEKNTKEKNTKDTTKRKTFAELDYLVTILEALLSQTIRSHTRCHSYFPSTASS